MSKPLIYKGKYTPKLLIKNQWPCGQNTHPPFLFGQLRPDLKTGGVPRKLSPSAPRREAKGQFQNAVASI